MKLTSLPQTAGAAWLRTFMLICAVVVTLGGAAQIWRGVKTMRGEHRAELTQLLSASDAALADAQRLASDATPSFQQLLNDVDGLGLEAFRAQHKESATKTKDMIGSAVEQFRVARSKLEAATKAKGSARLKPFLEAKARSYELVAQALETNQQMIDMVLDEPITDTEVLLPKLQEAAARRDALDRQAQAASEESNEIGKQLQGGS